MSQVRARLRARAAVAACLIVAASGCSEAIVPTTLNLNATLVSFSTLGRTRQLTGTVLDQNAVAISGAPITWSSSDDVVASVSSDGLVTANASGSATVTADAGGSATRSVTVNVTQVPASLTKVSGDDQTATVGQPLASPLVVLVSDSGGAVIEGANVVFGAVSGTASVQAATSIGDGTAQTSWTLGPGAGQQFLNANAPGGSAQQIVFDATGVADAADTLVLESGNGQAATPNTALGQPIVMNVRDQFGNPVAGTTVTFAVTSGGGSVNPTSAVSANDGSAQTVWTLGPGNGQHTATASALGQTHNLIAVGSPYFITLRYLSSVSASHRAAFDSAAAKWQRIITADLLDIPTSVPAGSCGSNPVTNETVDDVLIFVTVEPIDGVNGILGSAGPCQIRSSNQLPTVGRMRLDVADLNQLEASGDLPSVIIHEMGHVLGFGTLWGQFGRLQNPSLVNGNGVDTHFDGPQAIAAFDALGGTSYTGGAKVPVENTQGGTGTQDAHWRETTFATELMTGFLNSGQPNPLSRMSVASLADLGYTVDLNAADTYVRTFTLLANPVPAVHLQNDIDWFPIRVVDVRGRVLRTIQRSR